MKRLGLIIYLVVILLAFTGGVVCAQEFPQPVGLVNDFAGLLSNETEIDLEEQLVQLEQDTSAEIAVVIIDTLGEYSVEEYAVSLFENWGIGKKGEDNGVLFLISGEEREVRIEVGYGLEEILTDGRAGRILDDEVVPYFRTGDYEKGIINGVTAIENYIRDGTPPSPVDENPLQDFTEGSEFLGAAVFIVGWISLYVVGFIARSKSIWLGGIWGFIVGIVLGFTLGGLPFIIGMSIGMAGAGTLLDFILSRNYQSRVSQGKPTGWISSRGGFSSGSHSSSSRSSSRSSSGFGGGRSGGGGSSRRW